MNCGCLHCSMERKMNLWALVKFAGFWGSNEAFVEELITVSTRNMIVKPSKVECSWNTRDCRNRKMLLPQEGNIEFWAMDIFFVLVWKKRWDRDWELVITENLQLWELGIYDMVMSERWILQRMEGILLGYLKMTRLKQVSLFVLDPSSLELERINGRHMQLNEGEQNA